MYGTSSGFAIACQSSLVAIFFPVVTFIKVCELPKPKPSNIWSTISTLPPKNYLLRVNHKPFDSLLPIFSQTLASKTLLSSPTSPFSPHPPGHQFPPVLSKIQETAHQKGTQRFEPRGWGGFTHTIHGSGRFTDTWKPIQINQNGGKYSIPMGILV